MVGSCLLFVCFRLLFCRVSLFICLLCWRGCSLFVFACLVVAIVVVTIVVAVIVFAVLLLLVVAVVDVVDVVAIIVFDLFVVVFLSLYIFGT